MYGPKLGSKLHLAWVSTGVLRTGNVHLDFYLDVGSVFPGTAHDEFGKTRSLSISSLTNIYLEVDSCLEMPHVTGNCGLQPPKPHFNRVTDQDQARSGTPVPCRSAQTLCSPQGKLPRPEWPSLSQLQRTAESDPEPTSGPSRPWTGKFFSVSFGIRAKNGIPSKGLNDPTPHRRRKNLGLRFQV
jgi:hypothetical protein